MPKHVKQTLLRHIVYPFIEWVCYMIAVLVIVVTFIRAVEVALGQ